MNVNGLTRICGLIGDPVEHTLSPLIHNTLAEKQGCNLVYVPFHVKKENLAHVVKGAYGLNILGMNVTVPYKSRIIPYLDKTDALAAKIGAVNTLVRTDKGYEGYNTDITGLYWAMCSENIQLKDSQIVLLGAGGAARAAAFLCAEKGAKQVYLLNRSIDKAEVLADEVNRIYNRNCIFPMALADYEKLPAQKMTAIQSTSVGLYPNVEDVIIDDMEFYKNIHTAYDLIYKPEETKFMKLVKEAGGSAYNGLKMLLYQGITAYELWNHVSIPEETAKEVYELLKENVKS